METLNQTLIDCIRACGGSKQIAPIMWPEKDPESAVRLLLDCMNPERPAKLSPEQVIFVLRKARSFGYHKGIEFICGDLGYTTPQPIEPKDESAELMRQFIAATSIQADLVTRMEKAANRINLKAVA